MANLTQVLETLSTKEAAVSTADLAKELTASTEGTRKQLARLKGKGYVEGDSQEGWLITEGGRRELEKGGVHPSMIDEGVTPRQQFEAIGQRIGIKEDRIVLATDIVWSGDYNDVKWVWEALGQANIADDLRRVWVNAWRAKLHKGIPPELETELTRVNKVEAGGGKDVPSRGREYIIIDDEPVRVGENLGDYGLQDAKDILAIRALRDRFGGAGQPRGGSPPSAAEKVSDVLTALEPYLNKETDLNLLKELISDKMELNKQYILSRIPQPGSPTQPQTFIEQVTAFVGALSSLKEAGPTLRSILGVPESPGNPSAGLPVQVKGPDGQPIVMDLGQVIDWRKFQSGERREDERHGALMELAQTVRENFGDGISALRAAAEEAKGTGNKTQVSEQQPQAFKCGDCNTQFSAPAGWKGEPIKCPGCDREYKKEELLA
ncbi:hypothetical protein ES704_01611 [subsurface metagenome]|jgi:hypothetical protein